MVVAVDQMDYKVILKFIQRRKIKNQIHRKVHGHRKIKPQTSTFNQQS